MYVTGKTNKLSKAGPVKDLPLRPTISDIGTASCHLAKYLATLAEHHLAT